MHDISEPFPLNISDKARNCIVRELGAEELRTYVLGHDRMNSHALGVFDRQTGKLKGLWSVYVDWNTKEFLVNVLLAEKIESEVGGLRETGRPLYAIMFDELGMEALRFNVLKSNDRIQQRLTRQPEHVTKLSTASSADDAIHHFRINRQQYYEIRSQRAERDAEFVRKREERRRARS